MVVAVNAVRRAGSANRRGEPGPVRMIQGTPRASHNGNTAVLVAKQIGLRVWNDCTKCLVIQMDGKRETMEPCFKSTDGSVNICVYI